MSSDPGRPVVIHNTNSCCQGSGCGFVLLAVLVVAAWDALPRWAALLLAVGLGVPVVALAITAVYFKLNPGAPPLIGPNGWRARRSGKPTSRLSNEFRIANFNGGLAVPLGGQERGTLTLSPANRWELRFTGTSEWVFGKMTRFAFQATATGPSSCHVTMRDIQTPTAQAEFDLPTIAASVAQAAFAVRRFRISNYDGGLPIERKPHQDGTFVLTADNQWQLHFASTSRWLYGPCAGYHFDVTDTTASSCRVTMRATQAPNSAASFDLPDDSGEEVRGCIPTQVSVDSQAAPALGPQEPAPLPSAPAPNTLEQIRQLAEMRDSGILTEAEFEAKKTELLGRL